MQNSVSQVQVQLKLKDPPSSCRLNSCCQNPTSFWRRRVRVHFWAPGRLIRTDGVPVCLHPKASTVVKTLATFGQWWSFGFGECCSRSAKCFTPTTIRTLVFWGFVHKLLVSCMENQSNSILGINVMKMCVEGGDRKGVWGLLRGRAVLNGEKREFVPPTETNIHGYALCFMVKKWARHKNHRNSIEQC